MNKNQRLKGRRRIRALFEKGRAVNLHPVRVIYTFSDSGFPLQAGFSVSKKKFRKATHRNRIKRLMREAWRIHSVHLRESFVLRKEGLSLFLIYTGDELPQYSTIEDKVKLAIRKLVDVKNLPVPER